ncbi:ankyrin repeat protein [Zopfochytrium polystomum]|nr:ankyrin repeat protein [Zopfochytrium polystomum]
MHPGGGGERLSALQVAAWAAHEEVVRALLEAGAEVQDATGDGFTLLHLVAASRKLETVKVAVAKLLLRFGADRDAINWQGRTALQIARNNGSQQLASVLQGS